MSEDRLYEAIQKVVDIAQQRLEHKQELLPFGATIDASGDMALVEYGQGSKEEIYEDVVDTLRSAIKDSAIEAVVIVALSDIAEHYKSEHKNAIRLHLEERYKREEKLGARFIYIPYDIYRFKEEHSVKLYQPFSVAFRGEIFV